MNIELKTIDEVMQFFKSRHGYMSVNRICELLVRYNNIQAPEIECIKKHLHKLKREGFLLVKNEGDDIYNEEFASTPERVNDYFSEGKNEETDEIMTLKPEFYGMSIDLRRLWKRIKSWCKKK